MSAAPAGRSSITTRWGPPALTVLVGSGSAIAFLVLFLAVDRYSFWLDEATTGLVVRQTASIGDLLTFLRSTGGSETAQAIYYIVLWPWSRIAGDSEFALRLPSVVFTIGASIAIGFGLRQLGVSQRVALPAAASFVALPVVMWYAVEARPYALILFSVAVHIVATVSFLQRPTIGRLSRLALVTIAVAFAYSIAGLAALLSLLVALAWSRSSKRAAGGRAFGVVDRAIALGAVVAVGGVMMSSISRAVVGSRVPESAVTAIASLCYAAYELILGRAVGFSVTELRVAGGFNGALQLMRSQPGTLAVTVICSSTLLAVLIGGLRRIRPRRDADLLVVVAPWIVVAGLFCAYAIYPGFVLLGRHIVFVLPATTLLVVVGLSRTSRRGQLAAAAAVWIVGAVAFGGFLFDSRYAKDDFRAVARIVSDCRFRPDQIVLLASEHGFTYYGVQGIYGLRGRVNHFQAEGPESGDIQAGLSFLRAKDPEPAVIIVDISRFDRDGYVDQELRRNTGLHRLDLASLTMVSTVPLDGCAAH